MPIHSMSIKNTIVLPLAINYTEEAVLIHPIFLTFLAAKFDVLVMKQFPVTWIEVAKDISSIENGFRIIEKVFVFILFLGIAQIIDP